MQQESAIEVERLIETRLHPHERRCMRICLSREITHRDVERHSRREHLRRDIACAFRLDQHRPQAIMLTCKRVNCTFETLRVDRTGDMYVSANVVHRAALVDRLVEPDLPLR